jgi:hypothetical protein
MIANRTPQHTFHSPEIISPFAHWPIQLLPALVYCYQYVTDTPLDFSGRLKQYANSGSYILNPGLSISQEPFSNDAHVLGRVAHQPFEKSGIVEDLIEFIGPLRC